MKRTLRRLILLVLAAIAIFAMNSIAYGATSLSGRTTISLYEVNTAIPKSDCPETLCLLQEPEFIYIKNIRRKQGLYGAVQRQH